MKKHFKLRWVIIPAVLLALLGYVAYVYFHYYNYKEYRKYLEAFQYETGTEFSALEDSDPKIIGMVLASENDILKLYTNTNTTEVAIYDKRSGQITYSNPVNRDSDPLATGRNKVDLNSQFMLTYYDASMTMVNMYNYDYSVERKQYQIEAIENGIRYTYLLGNLDSPTGIVPVFITEERMQEKIISKLSEKEGKSFRSSYLESQTLPGFLELTQGAQASKLGLQKMSKLLEKAGYTQADFDEDAALASGGTMPERTTFTIVLEYRLEGDRLKVSVPTDQIKETGTGRLASISLLSYFGAGGTDEEGYLLVPNGSGSLIYFNNGKNTDRYNQYVYGVDETVKGFTNVELTEKVRLPVFGIKHEKSAVFAEITKGDALANIIAEVSGKTNSYNYVYPTFVLRGDEKVSMFGATGVAADLPTLEKDMYQLDLTVNYSFLEEKDASYSGMASYYRNSLIEKGTLQVLEAADAIPFYMDIVGGVKLQESILGVNYYGVYPMTTFEEAGLITDAFQEKGVENIRLNYLGWSNGGYYHEVPRAMKVERKLGGKGDLKELEKKLTADGIRLYEDVAIQKISFASENHYNWKMENTQYYSGMKVGFGLANPATLRSSNIGYMETSVNILSPKYLVRHIDHFIDKIDKLDLENVSLRDMGDTLTSDKKRTNVIDRQQAKQIVLGQMELLEEATSHLMLNGGNAYVWAYADDLQNVPANHNPFYIVDEEVPFYQMVIHGCIDYTAGAVNLSDSYDKTDIILKLIEYGMAPHFTLSYKESSKMKYSGMNILYTTYYKTWLADAAEIYSQTNEVLKHVANSTIQEHLTLQPGTKRVTYDNGVIIYINNNKAETKVDGITVPARGYVLEGVKE